MTARFKRLSLIQKLLVGFIIVLAATHITSVLLAHTYPDNHFIREFTHFFDLDRERNVPTLYSSIILGISAYCCVLLSTRCKRWLNRAIYYLFGAFFLYVAFDEGLILHETSAEPIRNLLGIGDGSPLYHAWVLPALVVLAGALLLYRFLRDTTDESRFQKRLLLLIVLLGAGVVFLEVVGTQIYVSPLAYKLGPVLIEEIFEISMVSLIVAKLSGRILHIRPSS